MSCWRDVAFSCGGVRLDASSHQYAGRITGKSGTMQLVRANRLAGGGIWGDGDHIGPAGSPFVALLTRFCGLEEARD